MAKSTFEIEDCECFRPNKDNSDCPCAGISGEIHDGFQTENAIRNSIEYFGYGARFLNGTFYWPTRDLKTAQEIAATVRSKMEYRMRPPTHGRPFEYPSFSFIGFNDPKIMYQIKFRPLNLNIEKRDTGYIVKLRTNSVARVVEVPEPQRFKFSSFYDVDPWLRKIDVKEKLV
jgi:hypothetical protein